MYIFGSRRWKTVEYSRSQIIKAGKTVKKLFNEKLSDEMVVQLLDATDVIDNWRAAHAYPMHVIYTHLRRLARNHTDITVAERLKRLDSIVNKLVREPTMSLWTMQDLGGCRFIVPTINDVYAYAEKYENSRKRHELKSTYDYLRNPKASGYRSLHRVYEYHSDKTEIYNKNMLIEIQFLTHLQHVWATAVETMGLFTKQAIKSGQGSQDVKRFFALVSSLFAIEEGCATVPGTPSTLDELITEIRLLNDKCNFLDMLSAIRVAVDNRAGEKLSQGYYILILNYNTRRLRVRYFKPSQIEEANEVYSQIEKERAESQIDAVLVSVSSFGALKTAYPNYFSDIGEFISRVKKYLEC